MYYNIFSPKFLNNMKGKIFTILFSMLVFVAFAAPPIIIDTDPPKQGQITIHTSQTNIVTIDIMQTSYVQDHVPDIRTMVSNDNSDAMSLVMISNRLPDYLNDVGNVLNLDEVYNSINSDDHPPTVSANQTFASTNNDNIIIYVPDHYDPGRCD